MKYKHTLKDIVKDNIAEFSHYQDGQLFYTVTLPDVQYEFPIPILDTGNGTFNSSEKALLCMRWVRAAMENETIRERIQ